MLEDMVLAATNEALRTAQDLQQKRLGGCHVGPEHPWHAVVLGASSAPPSHS